MVVPLNWMCQVRLLDSRLRELAYLPRSFSTHAIGRIRSLLGWKTSTSVPLASKVVLLSWVTFWATIIWLPEPLSSVAALIAALKVQVRVSVVVTQSPTLVPFPRTRSSCRPISRYRYSAGRPMLKDSSGCGLAVEASQANFMRTGSSRCAGLPGNSVPSLSARMRGLKETFTPAFWFALARGATSATKLPSATSSTQASRVATYLRRTERCCKCIRYLHLHGVTFLDCGEVQEFVGILWR